MHQTAPTPTLEQVAVWQVVAERSEHLPNQEQATQRALPGVPPVVALAQPSRRTCRCLLRSKACTRQ
eukprot:2488907-Alexandrium_andersonii.AAC.2